MKHPRQPVPLYIALAVLTFAAVMSLSVSTNAAEPPQQRPLLQLHRRGTEHFSPPSSQCCAIRAA